MKKTKLLGGLIAIIILIQVPATRALTANDLKDQDTYNYWKEVCSTAYSKNKAACDVFRQYVSDQQTAAEASIEDIKNSLEQTKIDISNAQSELTKYTEQVRTFQAKLNDLTNDIASIESSITSLDAQIIVREEKIVEMNELVKERLVGMESYIGSNMFFDFLLTSADFGDLLSRWDSIKVITEEDKQLVEQLNQEKADLENDKEQLNIQKDSLEETKVAYQSQLNAVESLQAALDEKLHELLESQNSLSEQIATNEKTQAEMDDIISGLGDITEIPSSGSWGVPISSRYLVTEVAWSYQSGGYHAGVDLAPRPYGTTAYALAPANGVVIHSNNNCASYNSYTCGDTTGYGLSNGGNQVHMIVSVDGKVYGVSYLHLAKGSASAPKTISTGDTVGIVGSSGPSTGVHLHIAVFYLGTNTLEYYASSWRNANFGAAGRNQLCDSGYGAPCRVTPQNLWGYYVGYQG